MHKCINVYVHVMRPRMSMRRIRVYECVRIYACVDVRACLRVRVRVGVRE